MSENLFDFLVDEEEKIIQGTYKVLIADDDIQVHEVTELMLQNFVFQDYKLDFLHAYSGEETKKILKEHPDIAVILLDVVMESSHAGLDVIHYIRRDLENELIRIILRTGQPGEAPEDQVIREYDINDYRVKTDLTVQRLYTSLYVAIRGYKQILRIENNRLGLEKIISASSNLFKNNSIEDFFKTILEQLSTFYDNPAELIYMEEPPIESHGFITMEQQNIPEIIAGTGRYEQYVGRSLRDVKDLQQVYQWIQSNHAQLRQVQSIGNGILIKKTGQNTVNNYIYIEGDPIDYDIDLINVFMTNYSIALDNYMLNTLINTTQSEIIITFADTIEKHFEETGRHIERISKMMYEFALVNNYSYAEAEVIKIASTMHDIGKIAIPDAILKKPAKLTSEEYAIIMNHPVIGHRILSKSDLKIMKTAAEIALSHHERFDGAGYPEGLKGKNIPLNARMMSIIDVFDAITHKRIYKEAESVEKALTILEEEAGKQFDPDLIDLFMRNYNRITDGNI